jgi:hypothetical protein
MLVLPSTDLSRLTIVIALVVALVVALVAVVVVVAAVGKIIIIFISQHFILLLGL